MQVLSSNYHFVISTYTYFPSFRFVEKSEYLAADASVQWASPDLSQFTYFDSPVSPPLGPDGEVHCSTPAWGVRFPSAETRVLLVEQRANEYTLHERVRESEFNYSFYAVWTGFNESLKFGARGGDLIHYDVWGANAAVTYRTSFQDAIVGKLESAACHVGGPRSLTCTTPKWGLTLPAANARVILQGRSSEDGGLYQNIFSTSSDPRLYFLKSWPL